MSTSPSKTPGKRRAGTRKRRAATKSTQLAAQAEALPTATGPPVDDVAPQATGPEMSPDTVINTNPSLPERPTTPFASIHDTDENPFAPNPTTTPAASGTQSTPSTAARFFAVTPSPRARGTPRAGRHSILRLTRRSEGPVGHKQRHAADDVWTFYDTTNPEMNDCLFCR